MNSIFMHWLVIIIGTLILSISISNPFYKLIIEKKIQFRSIVQIILRTILFLIGLVLIFIGLYLESI